MSKVQQLFEELEAMYDGTEGYDEEEIERLMNEAIEEFNAKHENVLSFGEYALEQVKKQQKGQLQ